MDVDALYREVFKEVAICFLDENPKSFPGKTIFIVPADIYWGATSAGFPTARPGLSRAVGVKIASVPVRFASSWGQHVQLTWFIGVKDGKITYGGLGGTEKEYALPPMTLFIEVNVAVVRDDIVLEPDEEDYPRIPFSAWRRHRSDIITWALSALAGAMKAGRSIDAGGYMNDSIHVERRNDNYLVSGINNTPFYLLASGKFLRWPN